MLKAIVVTHGLLGAELIRTAEAILGPQEGVAFLSNAGASLESLSRQVRGLLSDPVEPVLLFVDLLGGSCSHAGREIRGLHGKIVLVSGVNLPMLLEFFYNRDRVPLEELKVRLVEKGKDGIQCF